MVAVLPPPGAQGPPGPQGPAGADGTGDATYPHQQMVPSAVWTIDHGLGKHPAVTVITSAGDQVIGDVSYPSLDRVVITFSAPLGGSATLN